MAKTAPKEKASSAFFYGWVVVTISFITMAFMGAARGGFSVFFVPLFNEFGWSRAETATIASMRSVVMAAISPVLGALLDKYGPRKVFSAGGVLIAIGFIASATATNLWQIILYNGVISALGITAITTAPNSVVVSQWFHKKRGTAMGLATAGVTLGSFIVMLYQWFIDTWDWQRAYIIAGLMTAAVVIPLNAIFQRMRPEEKGLLPDGERGTAPVRTATGHPANGIHSRQEIVRWLLKNYKFWALCLGSLVMGVGLSTIGTHTIAYTVDSGLPAIVAASAMAVGGLVGFAGRLLSFLSDKYGREMTFTVCTIIYIMSIGVLLLLSRYPYLWVLYLYAILSGAFSLSAAIFYATIGDIFSRKYLGLITGLVVVGLATGEAIGPTFAGYIFDVTSSYTIAFVIAMGCAAVLCVAIWIAAPRHGTEKFTSE